MKTKFIIILIAFSVSNIFAQTDSLMLQKSIVETLNKKATKQEFEGLKKEIKKHKQEIKTEIDSLYLIIDKNYVDIKKTAKELGVEIEDTNSTTSQSIKDLSKIVSQNTLYWIIGILVVALFVLLVFILLRKQLFKQKTDLEGNLEEARKVFKEEFVKLDNKLIEILEELLKRSSPDNEKDHSLALKVADEIIRIQKNLDQMYKMDEKTKGLKQLKASVRRIQDTFTSNGYELVEMLGKPYNDGMKVSATFISDEDLEPGQQIITRIIKPQVNYKGIMIQPAQIEVSQR